MRKTGTKRLNVSQKKDWRIPGAARIGSLELRGRGAVAIAAVGFGAFHTAFCESKNRGIGASCLEPVRAAGSGFRGRRLFCLRNQCLEPRIAMQCSQIGIGRHTLPYPERETMIRSLAQQLERFAALAAPQFQTR